MRQDDEYMDLDRGPGLLLTKDYIILPPYLHFAAPACVRQAAAVLALAVELHVLLGGVGSPRALPQPLEGPRNRVPAAP